MNTWSKKIIVVTFGLLALATNLMAAVKVDKNVAYGPHKRNIMDIHWNTEYKNAPIVITICGGGFKSGNKGFYCNGNTQKLYRKKGCVIVSPDYRLLGGKGALTLADCEIDCAMAAAYIQANAAKYGGDPKKIVATGGSAGGYLSALLAYRKKWKWPAHAKYKPEKLNIIGWYGDSPLLPPRVMNLVTEKDPPGFMIYGKKEHPATPAKMGHNMQDLFTRKKIWSKMVYVENGGHSAGKQVLINSQRPDNDVFVAFDQFLDMVCFSKGKPKGGDVITVAKKGRDVVTITGADRGAAAPVRKGYHLFVLSGQSNMVAMDPKVSFAPAIHKEFGADKVIIVKKAWGGCPISQWYKQWKPKPNAAVAKGNGKYYDELMVDVKKAIKGKELATVTLIWMQGEFDANRGRHNAYKDSLAGLVKQFSDDMERDDLNFVIGRLSDCGLRGRGAPKWEIVRKAQVAVAEKSRRGGWIDTDDLNGPGDGLHMTRKGYVEMGKRFAGKAIELIKGK